MVGSSSNAYDYRTSYKSSSKSDFAQFSLPERVLSDNGPTFIRWEFKSFLHQNVVERVMSASYNLATNGLVGRAVHTFSEGLKKLKNGDMQTKLARLLSNAVRV